MLTSKREAQIGRRLKEGLEGSQDNWESLCQDIVNSPFLMGKNKTKWKVSIDWILNPTNMAKVLEGNYQNNNPPAVRSDLISYEDEMKRIEGIKNGTY